MKDEITQTIVLKKCWCRDDRGATADHWLPRWNILGTNLCLNRTQHKDRPDSLTTGVSRWEYIVFEKPNDGRPILKRK